MAEWLILQQYLKWSDLDHKHGILRLPTPDQIRPLYLLYMLHERNVIEWARKRGDHVSTKRVVTCEFEGCELQDSDASVNEHALQRPAPPGWVCAYVIITKTDVLFEEKRYAELSGQNSSIALECSVIDYWEHARIQKFS